MDNAAPPATPSAATHVFRLRVYYEDTDAAGIVYYANYFKFAERARTEMLRAAGIENRRYLETRGVAFAVRRCTAEFLAPAKLDDLLEVHSRILRVRGASIEAEQRVIRDARAIAHIEVMLACVGQAGRPARLPPEVIAAFAPSAKPSPAQSMPVGPRSQTKRETHAKRS
ncbi:MAG: tol-pal system-associated acyl-CoA thioesterase [Rhodospirillales bacterium]|nr:tol-pal system-associated acyl-CoA thioesterase [Rhodospirillales bacterium]